MSKNTKVEAETVTETVENEQGIFETVAAPNVFNKSLGFIKRHKRAITIGAVSSLVIGGLVIKKRYSSNSDTVTVSFSEDLIENIGDGLSSTAEAITDTVAEVVED